MFPANFYLILFFLVTTEFESSFFAKMSGTCNEIYQNESAITKAPESDEGVDNFLILVETFARHLFSGKGYNRPEYWNDYVNATAIRDTCFFGRGVQPTLAPSLDNETVMPSNNIECTVQLIDQRLSQLLHDVNVFYFYMYIAFSLFLITLAVLFNVVAITAVSRCHAKYPRHHFFISLSISDLILTNALLLKRCGDQEGVISQQVRHFLSNNVAVLFQIGYIMSALGLLCLSLDNVLAVAAPYYYESFSRPRTPRLFISCIWTTAVAFATIIRLLNLHTSLVVQMAVCVSMLILLVVVLSSYIFTCAQAHVHRRRLEVSTSNRVDLRNQLRGFLTTGLLVFCCLVCWSPLIGYLLTDDETLSSAHLFFTRYLVAALLVLHLNSVIDPVIYCLRLRDIRKSLFRLLGITKRGRQQSSLLFSSQVSSFRNDSRYGSRKSAPPRTILAENYRRNASELLMRYDGHRPLTASQVLAVIDDAIENEEGTYSPEDHFVSAKAKVNRKGRQTRAMSAAALPNHAKSQAERRDDFLRDDRVFKSLCEDNTPGSEEEVVPFIHPATTTVESNGTATGAVVAGRTKALEQSPGLNKLLDMNGHKQLSPKANGRM